MALLHPQPEVCILLTSATSQFHGLLKTPDNCPNHYRHLCACLYLEPLLLLSSLCSGIASRHKECHHVASVAEWCFQTPLFSVIQACLILCNPTDCSPPGYSVHWILQARTLEQVAMASFRGSSQPRDQIRVSCTAGEFFTVWATRKALPTPLKMFNSLTQTFESERLKISSKVLLHLDLQDSAVVIRT